MAILKALETQYGVSVSYHRIIAININYLRKRITLCVASYVSKEARKQNLSSLEEVDISVPSSDFSAFSEESIMACGYNWLKHNVVGFEEAENCFEICEPVVESEVEEMEDLHETD